MKICFPTDNNHGLESRLAGHFGSAPFYTIRDTDTGTLESVPNRGHAQAHGQCSPADRLSPLGVDTIVCGGIGKRALARLKQGGVTVYVSNGGTVADALAEYEGGKLREPSVDEVCGGRGHRSRNRGCGE